MAKYDVVTGGGGNQNTVDFSLSSDQVYTQETGNTLDLSVLDVIQSSLSESITVNDSLAASTDYFRVFGEQVTVNEADIRQYSKPVTEVFTAGESRASSIGKSKSENLTANEVYGRKAVFERNYLEDAVLDSLTELKAAVDVFESLTVNDSDIRQTEKLLSETFAGADTASTDADLFRSVSEAFSLDETFSEIKVQVLDVSEDVGVNSLTELQAAVELSTESFTLSDDYSRSVQLPRDYGEEIGLDEQFSLLFGKNLSENLSLDAFTEIKLLKDFAETFSVSEDIKSFVGRSAGEVISTDDSIREKGVAAVLSQGFFIDDADIRNVSKPLQESVFPASSAERQADLFRSYSEQQSIDESFRRFVSKPVNEVLSIEELRSSEIQRALTQSLELREVYIDTAELFRGYDEELGLSDVSDRKQDLFRNYEADIALNEDEVLGVGKSVTQSLALDDVYGREVDYFREQVERPRFRDRIERAFTRPVTESFAVDESIDFLKDFSRSFEAVIDLEDSIREKRISKSATQSLALDEAYGREADYFRDILGELETAATKRKTLIRPVTESLVFDEKVGFQKFLFRSFEEVFHLEDSIPERGVFKKLQQSVNLKDEFDFFFSEGPGVSPYHVRNSFVQNNSLQNSYVTKTIQNLFTSLNFDNSFGDEEQT